MNKINLSKPNKFINYKLNVLLIFITILTTLILVMNIYITYKFVHETSQYSVEREVILEGLQK